MNSVNVIAFKDARVGRIYVTQGGLIEDAQGNKLPWGYERVRLIKKDTVRRLYIFETPWGTELEVSENYTIHATPESDIRSEHKMIGLHKGYTIQRIPFDKAVKEGICVIDGTQSSQNNSDNDIRQQIANYFNVSQKITDAAKFFNLQYPRMRSHVEYIKKNGISGVKYRVLEGIADDGKKTIQLTKEQTNE